MKKDQASSHIMSAPRAAAYVYWGITATAGGVYGAYHGNCIRDMRNPERSMHTKILLGINDGLMGFAFGPVAPVYYAYKFATNDQRDKYKWCPVLDVQPSNRHRD
jgi:hypothetical protein